mmetsp:Transcript_5776/g.4385  ORF Transcript_5776/g.4385 Transcript_5776/m.4385 type:complete len:80 (-) Transcript_5776:16-255(-)
MCKLHKPAKHPARKLLTWTLRSYSFKNRLATPFPRNMVAETGILAASGAPIPLKKPPIPSSLKVCMITPNMLSPGYQFV